MEPEVKPGFKPSLFERLLISAFHLVNKFVAWHKLPSLVGALNLDALRIELRQYNLHDAYPSGAAQGSEATEPMTDPRFMHVRNSDGKFNSTEMPLMGCAGMRFGHNFPRASALKPTEAELWNPNPRMVSCSGNSSDSKPVKEYWHWISEDVSLAKKITRLTFQRRIVE